MNRYGSLTSAERAHYRRRARKILRRRQAGKSLDAIAEEIGISREMVRRILNRCGSGKGLYGDIHAP